MPQPGRPDADASAARDLLFGLVALQNGLIEPPGLASALRTAGTDPGGGSLADRLSNEGLDPEDRTAVEVVVDRHVRKHGGNVEKSLASVRAGWITRQVLALVNDPDLRASFSSTGEDPDATSWPGSVSADAPGASSQPPRGERFRVLRPHARGGLGEVFVALDGELRREVALKEILPNHADNPASRRRFLVEAEITGGLEHPGIVPVYGLGVYPNGRPYYAMRFIRGESLKDAIGQFHDSVGSAARPAPEPASDPAVRGARGGRTADATGRSLELRKLLRRFQDVCNAVDYAHSRGVLHRDIKPANVVVGKYGETFVVDWGLAKARGESGADAAEPPLTPASSSGGGETLPGSALGTPAYMSPEQARGELDRLDARSDVYSLGATLYHLLTGRAPVSGDVSQALRSVKRGEFPRPRLLDPSIDPALEAVCLKAMALDPGGRYASARLLSDDVDRWLADEPVSAWREPFARRARRWMRRHRTAVTAAAASLLVAIVGLASVLAVQTRAKADLLEANGKLNRTNAALAASNERERQRFGLAAEAIRSYTDGVQEDETLKNPGLQPLRAKLLKRSREFYRKLEDLLKDQDDPRSVAALASAYFDVGALDAEIGDLNEGLASFQRALVNYEKAARAEPAATAYQSSLAKAHNNIGSLLKALGREDEALASFGRAEAIHRRLVQAGPENTEFLSDLARHHHGTALVLDGFKKPAEALAAYQRALEIRQRLADADPARRAFQRDLAGSHNGIAGVLHETGRLAEAEASYDRARAILQRLADADPADEVARADLATSDYNLGGLYHETGRPREALAALERSRGVRKALADARPAVTQLQVDLAESHNNLATLLRSLGRPAEALAEFEQARAVDQKLADANPDVTRFQADLALAHNNIGVVLRALRRPAEALASYERGLAVQKKRAEANPRVRSYQRGLALNYNNIGNLLGDLGKPAEARAAYEQALAIRRRLVDASPDDPVALNDLAVIHNNLGIFHADSGRPDEAAEAYERALAIQRKLAGRNPNVVEYQSSLGLTLHNLSRVEFTRKRHAAARDLLRQARDAQRLAYDANPNDPLVRRYLNGHLTGLARNCLILREPAEAAGAARDLAALNRADPVVQYNSACYLARCAGLVTDPAGSERDASDAVTALSRAVAAGWSDAALTAADPDLSALHGRDDFERVLVRMFDRMFPEDPFGR